MFPRTLTIPGQWAANAQTIIPAPPIPGVAYRNPALDAATMRAGQQYSRIADSAQWNQLHYLTTGFSEEIERYGIPRYSPLTNYYESAFCLSLDGALMQAIKPSGPANGGAKPTTDSAYWKVAIDFDKSIVRTKVYSLQTFYIRTDGNNNNSGLENTPQGAFRDWTGLVAAALKIDFNGVDLHVIYGPGVFSCVAHCVTATIFMACNSVFITGDTTAETIFRPQGPVSGQGVFNVSEGLGLHVSNVTVDFSQYTSKEELGAFIAQRSSYLRLTGRIKAIGSSASSDELLQGFACYHGAVLEFYNTFDITVTGTWRYVAFARYHSSLIWYTNGGALKLSATFKNFLSLYDLALAVWGPGVSVSGSAVGRKYFIFNNCGIINYGQGTNAIPGTDAGILSAGAYFV